MATTKKDNTKSDSLTLTVAGVEINVTHERVPIDSVHLDPQNPRIRFQVEHGAKKKVATEKDVFELVKSQPGYDSLQKQIRKLGGIYDPVIIRHNGMVVEGNSRVTAIKTLHRANPSDPKWKTVPVTRLPADVPERAVAMLMANFHIGGKTVWRPSAKADQIHQLRHKYDWSIEQIADETRMSPRKVNQYLDAYQFLIDEVLPEVEKGGKVNRQEILESKFSHALEYISGKQLEAFRQDSASRKKVAKLIAHDKIKGAEVRKLPPLMTHKEASSVLVTEGFKAANNVLKKSDPTVESKLLKSMRQMTDTLKSMNQDDIELLKKNAKAQQVFLELAQSVKEVMAVAKLKLR